MRHLFTIAAILTVGLVFPHALAAQEESDWKLICADGLKPETCKITLTLFFSKKVDGKQKIVGKVLGLTVVYVADAKSKKRQPHLSIQMPLGVDLRRGAVLKVDKGKEIPVRYLRCTNNGCDASLKLDSKFLKALKAGNNLFVGFLPWGGNKNTAVNASLKGFNKAFNTLK